MIGVVYRYLLSFQYSRTIVLCHGCIWNCLLQCAQKPPIMWPLLNVAVDLKRLGASLILWLIEKVCDSFIKVILLNRKRIHTNIKERNGIYKKQMCCCFFDLMFRILFKSIFPEPASIIYVFQKQMYPSVFDFIFLQNLIKWHNFWIISETICTVFGLTSFAQHL